MERIYEDERLCSQFAEDNFFIKQSDDPKKVPERKKSVDESFALLVHGFGQQMEETFFPRFLRFITKSMLNPDRSARANAKCVESFLEERLQKHPPNSSYWRF
ncbi:hypothetical protein GGI42DRAFT_353740 [Trichoderma sp. SZMC 28013]